MDWRIENKTAVGQHKLVTAGIYRLSGRDL